MDTPGSQALAEAKKVRDLDIFKKPMGAALKSKKSKSTILDEHTFIEKMGIIIERDFFPHLEKLKAQNDYLDALEQNNFKRMRELYEKYSSGQPISERVASPATFETPLREDQEDPMVNESQRSQRRNDLSQDKTTKEKMGLDTYLCTHTSEDNASFEELMMEAEQKQRIKYSWLFEYEEKSKIQAIEGNKLSLEIENGKRLKPSVPEYWTYTNKNYIMYVPDGVELTPDEKIEMAKRKQEVNHDNTRLTVDPFNEKQNKETICELAKNQSKTNNGKIGVDGKEVITSLTPKINGFSFVATPSPRPGECESPLMTWGQIEGTPFRLDGGDTPVIRTHKGPSFRMAEPPKREKLALQLAEKAGERHRDRKSKALEAARKSFATPSPRSQSTIDRLATMSPAARRLATQKLRIVSTPSPRRGLSRTPSIGIKTPSSISRGNTPNRTPTKNSATSVDEYRVRETVLTDNLLNLPQRQRAADFFQ